MAQYSAPIQHEHAEPVETHVASPIPLGLSVLAFTTIVLGCVYAGFIVPFNSPLARTAVGGLLFIGGIVQILAGMWEFRKNNTIAATVFSAYGGFLAALGMIFVPSFGILSAVGTSGVLVPVLGLLFLGWTIFTAVLVVGSLRTDMTMLVTLVLLFLTFLFLTIGQLAGENGALLRIGGWLGIICGLVAWYSALAHLLRLNPAPGFRLPMGGTPVLE
ncbi:MAG: acetate uptake transporter [Ktedonobacteraceae bacterium]|nr:acetate uptake transporter [Ktedonobacteraceae bacterium]